MLSIGGRLRRVDGELVMRAYTPTSSDDDMGYFDLVIKARACARAHPVHPCCSCGFSRTCLVVLQRLPHAFSVGGCVGRDVGASYIGRHLTRRALRVAHRCTGAMSTRGSRTAAS